MLMRELQFNIASEQDIPFIMEVYNENISSLHGNYRNFDDWKSLISTNNSTYFIASSTQPVAWFILDFDDEMLWLGMIQVKPKYHRQGIGRSILSFIENFAKEKQIHKIGIHTTEDNIAARALYETSKYTVSEIGTCTTSDGVERIGYTFKKRM